MGTNKVASVILLDVSRSMSAESDNSETFFKRSQECVKKMILRKIFSQDNDDLGIVLFGTDDTENDLARSTLYNHITVFSRLALPTWELYRKVENLSMSNRTETDWIEALIVAIDFMKTETQGRRYRNKQIVVFSSFSGDIKGDADTIQPLVATLEGEKVSLVVVGSDMSYEYERKELTSSLHLVFNTVNQLESGIHYSFAEIEKDLMYFEKKRKMNRLLKVNLSIGSNIQLPARWMKLTNEETRFKWEFLPREKRQHLTEQSVGPKTALGEAGNLNSKITNEEPAGQKSILSDSGSRSNEIKFITDIVKTTNFGSTFIELSYADIEAMSRKTGAPSLIYLGSVKSSKIARNMFVSNDVYVIVPDKDARSVAMFSALVDGLITAQKYGIARRVAVKNGKVVVGALLPVSDEFGKALTFLKLPFAEWVQKVPEKPLREPDNEEGFKAIDDLIEATMLPEDLVEEGKGLLVRDPTFQSRCHALHQRAIGKLPESSIIELPEPVKHIINPFPLNDNAKNALQRIATIFPFIELDEKAGSLKRKSEHSRNNETNLVSDAELAKVREEYEQVKRNPEKAVTDPYSGNVSDDLFE